jgi:antitoxin component of RelBE/YafQ-DinJ toxin-antitoxin module
MLFFIKIRESSLPVDVLREREQKWLKMIRDWDTWMTKKFPKVPKAMFMQTAIDLQTPIDL